MIPPSVAGPVLLAWSGGMDSTVLLHLLAQDADQRARGLRAIHVHHGLHPDADAWAAHCEALAHAWSVPLTVVRVNVDRDSGLGIEASARQSRRAAFAAELRDGECLALAQHRDDQAETFLMRALRASGPDGLAAMRPWRAFGKGWMWRPLLDTSRDTLHIHARAHGLPWVDDPSNADAGFDRNFLRLQVMPLLRERWPHADAALSRAAHLAAESSDILAERDAAILSSVREEAGPGLSVIALRLLSPARRARLFRYWATSLGWPPLPAEGIARIEQDLIASGDAAHDRLPGFAWHGVAIRRWRDALYAIDGDHDLPRDWACEWDGSQPLALPNGDTLRLKGAARFPTPVRAHARQGGERIQLPERGPQHHSLKHVLQELEIAPWHRSRMPLLSTDDGTLLAAGDRIRSAGFDLWMQAHDASLVWTRHREADGTRSPVVQA
ncbi:MAG: tRNA lysidine(34) synthetase TilS [Xanthomonadaceae bacterium]|nr:tRNA lysidine(34) synthetase TilS [Xanthomonadaceae bacterium]